ncbi:cation-translocating P-type ATPase [Candidatus Acetothermia bacterium]|jgi:Ca2+-transporting ATPase|nr:cation-translocating P-type ATPase [Candidatus Acetothermia bacterium]
MPKENWYNLKSDEVISSLNASSDGLSQKEAQKRLSQFGPNELAKKKKISPWLLLLEQFKNYLILILLIATVISAIQGKEGEAILIFAIVLLAGILGFIQEYKAERAMEALKRMAAPTASALRDGKETEIAARELVPGDIILLRTGDRIPADARLIESVNLRTEEAPLTGESAPIDKIREPIEGEVSVGDRRNMVFMGTAAVYGRGKAIITATGMATEFGKIATWLQEVKTERTPLQVNIDRLGKVIGTIALVLAVLIATAGVVRGYDIFEMFVWGVALAVAIIPEALPAVVVVTLSLAARRMVKRRALIRKLPAVETLGSTTFICSDKTGTLTQDEMTLRRIYTAGKLIDVTGTGYEPKGEFHLDGKVVEPRQDTALETLLRAGSLCNDTSLTSGDGRWEIKGDPTEGAFVVAAAKAGLWQEELSSQSPRIDEIPFSSETKRMTTVHQTPQGKVAYSKGAPEVILDSCRYIYANGEEKQLTDKDKDDVLSVAQTMAGDALRVLGLAYRRLPTNPAVTQAIEQDMVFVGLAGMIDPPREEVKEAVKLCDQAGIKSVMITGDHKLTAIAIAKELGLLKEGVAVSGAELDSLSDEEFETLVEKIEVYARVSPAHKLRIVEALIKKGHIVAMTGDGVNDAPALKKAGIGVAMGITGTDVTKEASDMVLTDDNFASIVSAVEEGRTIFANIRKYLTYLLSGNAGAVLAMIAALLVGLPIPLTPVLILFINLLMDGAPAVALGVEPPEKGVMKKPPRNPKSSIFNRHALLFIPGVGAWIGVTALLLYNWMLNTTGDLAYSMTMFFVAIICLRLANASNCRSPDYSLFQLGPFTNKWLIYACASSFAMLLMVLYVPFLQVAFRIVPLSLADWAIIIPLAFTVIIVVEIQKRIASLLKKRQQAQVAL